MQRTANCTVAAPHSRRIPHSCRKRKQAKCRHHHRQQLVSGRVLVRDSATWPSNPTSSEEMAVMASRSMELNVQSGRGKDASASFHYGQLLAHRPSHASGASPLGLAAPSSPSSSLRVGKGPAVQPRDQAFLYIFVVLLFFPLLSSCFWVLKPSIPPSFRNHSRGRCLFCNDVLHRNAYATWCKTA